MDKIIEKFRVESMGILQTNYYGKFLYTVHYKLVNMRTKCKIDYYNHIGDLKKVLKKDEYFKQIEKEKEIDGFIEQREIGYLYGKVDKGKYLCNENGIPTIYSSASFFVAHYYDPDFHEYVQYGPSFENQLEYMLNSGRFAKIVFNNGIWELPPEPNIKYFNTKVIARVIH